MELKREILLAELNNIIDNAKKLHDRDMCLYEALEEWLTTAILEDKYNEHDLLSALNEQDIALLRKIGTHYLNESDRLGELDFISNDMYVIDERFW